MKKNFIKYGSFSIRILVGSILIISSISKLIDITSFQKTIQSFSFFDITIANIISYVIPSLELLLGIFLFLGFFIKFSVIHINILLVFFSWISFYSIRKGLDFSCGCFGNFWELKFSWYHLIILFVIFTLNMLLLINQDHVWSLEKIIKNKLTNNAKIKISNLIVYLVIIISLFLFIFLMLFIFLAPKEDNAQNKLSSEIETTNKKEFKKLTEVVPITVEDVYLILLEEKDYLLLDVRTKEEYIESHIEGSKLIPLAELENRLSELSIEKPTIVYCQSGQRSKNAAEILVENGFKEIYNMIGGMIEWQRNSFPVAKGEEKLIEAVPITVDDAYEFFIDNKNYLFLDVRSVEEYNSGHIEGSLHIPLPEIRNRLDELSKDIPIIVYCNGSSCGRSLSAATILLENGFNEVYNLIGGGITEWEEKGYPILK